MRKTLLFLLALTVCAPIFAFSQTTQPTFTSSSKPILVPEKDSIFVITLQSNPTTGFSWTLLKFDPTVVRVLGHKYVAPTNAKRVGAPGYEVWSFQIKHHVFLSGSPQTTQIMMQYVRPWEIHNGGTQTTFTVKIQ